MPTCSRCGRPVEESHAFCPHCGFALREGTQRPQPSAVVASARPVSPPLSEFLEERTLLQRLRPMVEGLLISFFLGLLYMLISLNVAKAYTPLMDFYRQLSGLIWPAILAVGTAWAGKDERENSFIAGALTGFVAGLLLALAEDSLHQWRTFALRHLLGTTILGASVGLVAGTLAGILGSPVMVRFPVRQKHIALGFFVGLVALAIITVSLPSEPATYFLEIGAVYYNKSREVSAAGEEVFHKGLLRLAKLYFERAIEREPRLADAHNNLAVALQQLGDEEGALLHWRQAKILDPSLPEPHKNLGIVYMQRGLAEGDESLVRRAIEEYRRFLEVAPTPDAGTLYNLALGLYHLGDLEQALTFAKEAAQIAPQDQQISALLKEIEKAHQASTVSPPPPSSPP